MPSVAILSSYSLAELRKEISKTNIKKYSTLKKADVIQLMLKSEHKDKFHHLKMKEKKAAKSGTHKMPDGTVMSGATHSADSKPVKAEPKKKKIKLIKKEEPKPKAAPKPEKKPTAPRGYGVALAKTTGKYYYYDLSAENPKSQYERPKRKTDEQLLKEKLEVGKYYYLKTNKKSSGVEVVKILKLGKDKLEYEGRISKESPARGMMDDVIKREVTYSSFKPLKPKSIDESDKLLAMFDWDGVSTDTFRKKEGKF